ncbi:hypothetical protein Clacol_007635 [Clathrus columnatus]|uniref:Uncharacterized protein n=1 Tax=Clathrus columnatus TaxID=1419009 RepID=A0AAV5AFG4_9AGAM|nr:hypothetical protein Clacol_007635 [Clathrus columnatus]
MASASSFVTQDISSLRAAALLTLKPRSKSRPLPRRTSPEHPDDTSSIASTLRAPPSPELDYGSDDASGDAQKTPVNEEKKEGEKEEGEISDDETHRVVKPNLSMADIDNEPLPGLTSILNYDTNGNALSGFNGSIKPSGTLGSRLSTSSNPQPLDAENSTFGLIPSSSMPSSLFLPSSFKVDAEHVRPSLRMTAEEFAEAKEIILDLLGWSVPAEYLINCGLTREAIYYVFTELNLELPSNFDTTGIAPYPQFDKPKSTLLTSPLQSSNIPSNPASQQPDHPSPPLSPTAAKLYANSASIQSPRDSVSSSTVDMYSEPIPGLLQSTYSHDQSQTTIVTTNGDQGVRSTKEIPRHVYAGNLDEIETLRRQELLARKAALASRRKLDLKKQTISTTLSNTNVPKSPPISPVVSGEAVDNFLKSITSTNGGISIADGNNVDVAMEDNEPQPPTPSTSSSVAWGQFAIPLPKKPASKRAVASDWIDYETSSRNSPYPTFNGNGEYADIRRTSSTSNLSFANLISNRKVVIDFSDSDDDSPAENSTRSMNTSVGDVLRMTSQLGTREAMNLRHVPTPEALLLKEQEIKRMKELIAEREKNRLKKLANPPKGFTPPPVDSFRESGIPEGSRINNEETAHIHIKQEQDITPPLDPPNADIGAPIGEEDSVMQDIPDTGTKLSQLGTSDNLFIDRETAIAQPELTTESSFSDAASSETQDVPIDDNGVVPFFV